MSRAKISLVMVWPQQLFALPGSEHSRIAFWLDSITILYAALSVSLVLPLSSSQGCTLKLHRPYKQVLLSSFTLEDMYMYKTSTSSLSQPS